jgi:hypothetical protein
MPKISRDFDVGGDIIRVWSVLNDPVSLGACIPGCEEVTALSSTEWRFNVKVNVGVISKRIDARAHVIERKDPHRIAIKLMNVDRDFSGTFTVELELDKSNTHVFFTADVDAKGPFQWIVDQVIKNQLDKMVNEFAERVSQKTKAGT